MKQVQTDERPIVVLVALVFFATQSTHALMANTADALFLSRFGVESLPTMYMMFGIIGAGALLAYAAGIAGTRRVVFYPVVLGLIAVVLVGLRLMLLAAERWMYAATWIVASIAIATTFVLMWNVAADVADARSGKRLYPLFASAGILGGVAGNLATGALATSVGVEQILVVAAAILVLVAVLASVSAHRFGKVAATSGGARQELRAGYERVKQTPLLRRLSAAMLLSTVLFYAVAFPFSIAVAEEFATTAEIASFLGLFAAAATVATFLVSLLGAGAIFRAIGVVGALLVVGSVYLVGFSLWLLTFGLVVAAIVRFVQWMAVNGLGATAQAAVFNTVRSEHRGAVIAFLTAVPLQLGIFLAGFALWAVGLESTTPLFLIGLVAAALYVAAVISMRRHYLESLVDALRRGVHDAFLIADRGIVATRVSSETAAALRDTFANNRSEVRRAGLEIAARAHLSDLAPDAKQLLDDADVTVRLAAAEFLAELNELPQPDRRRLVEVASSVSIDSGVATRRRAAVLLDRLGEAELSDRLLCAMADDSESTIRAGGLVGLAEIGRVPSELSVFNLMVDDESPEVRSAAVAAVAAAGGGQASDILPAFADPSEQVRRSTAHAWRAHELPKEPLLDLLSGDDIDAQEAALMALAPADPDLAKQVGEMVEPSMQLAEADWRNAAALASSDSGAADWIADLLDQRSWSRQKVVIRAIEVDHDHDTGELIVAGLRSMDSDARAQAMEALDSNRSDVSRRLIAMNEPLPSNGFDVEQVLENLAGDADQWLRALALYTIGEIHRANREPAIRESEANDSPVVRSAAASLAEMAGDSVSELFDMVGPVERAIALRSVPIFSSLLPEDLDRIATVASERTYDAGSTVFRAGERGDELVVVLEGTLSVSYRAQGGSEIFAEFGEGEQVGELSMLRDGPRSSNVIASTDARVLAIGKDVVESLLVERPHVARAILASIADRLAAVAAPVTDDDIAKR